MKKDLLIKLAGGAAAAVALYFGYTYYQKSKAKSGSNKVAAAVINGTTATLPKTNVPANPPPGYTGPTGGPFTWGGAGAPPDGVTTIQYI
jgi:hypothetical protein